MARAEILGRSKINQLFGTNEAMPVVFDADMRPSFDLLGAVLPVTTNVPGTVSWSPGAGGNTPINSNGTLMRSGGSPNVGDWAEWKFPMPRRDAAFPTWGMFLVGYKSSNSGQMIVKLNGTQVQMFDLYNASVLIYNSYTDLGSGAIDTSKATLNTLRLEVAAKNASSTAHHINIVSLCIYPNF